MKWINYGQLILGLWVLVTPWILGYASVTPALWSSVIAGVFIALLALWSILGDDQNLS